MNKSLILPGIVTFLLPFNFRGPDIIAIFIFLWFLQESRHLSLFIKNYTLPTVGYLCCAILYISSALYSGNLNLSFVFNTIFAQLLFINYLSFLLFDISADYPSKVKLIATLITLSIVLSSIVSMLQVRLGIGLAEFQFDILRNSRMMAYAGDPNILGLATILPVFICSFYCTKSFRRGLAAYVLNSIAIVGLLLVLFSTQSRSAIAGYLLALLTCYKGFYKKNKLCYSLIVLNILGLASYLAINIHIQINRSLPITTHTKIAGSSVTRLYHKSNSNSVISERYSYINTPSGRLAEMRRAEFVFPIKCLNKAVNTPIIGVGPGNAASTINIKNSDGVQLGCHNTFAQIFLENGLILGMAYILLVSYVLLILFRLMHYGAILQEFELWPFCAIAVAISIISMYQDLLGSNIFWMNLSICCSCIMLPKLTCGCNKSLASSA